MICLFAEHNVHSCGQAAGFLSTLATDITVGLDSWVAEDQPDQARQQGEAVTCQDQLEVLRENKRWQQCLHVYSKAGERKVDLSLLTIMVTREKIYFAAFLNTSSQNGMLRPDDIQNIETRVKEKKSGMFASREAREQFMAGHFGRGIILIAISLIKHSWWLVLRANYERLQHQRRRRNSFTLAQEQLEEQQGWSMLK